MMTSPAPTSLSEYRDQVIEEGWFTIARTVSSEATQEQVEQARKIFYAGVLHLWEVLQEIMSDDTVHAHRRDIKLADIHAELERFVAELPLNGVH